MPQKKRPQKKNKVQKPKRSLKKAKITQARETGKPLRRELVLSVIDPNGKVSERLPLDPLIVEMNGKDHLIYQAGVMAQANRRLGTAKTKTRGEVRGGGRKPWRQKGTGRARHGSIRSPLWRKGGVVFGPRPRDYGIKLPSQMRARAIGAALNRIAYEGKLFLVEDFTSKDGKTKELAKRISQWGFRKVLVILPARDPLTLRAARNLESVQVTTSGELSSGDVLACTECLFTRKGYERLLERLKERLKA